VTSQRRARVIRNARRYRRGGNEYRKVCGTTLRLLNAAEIAEFQAAVADAGTATREHWGWP
jgi:hypothetical protein